MDKSTNPMESYYRFPHVVDNDFRVSDKALLVNCTGHTFFRQPIHASSVRHDYYCYFLTRGGVTIRQPIHAEMRPGDLIVYEPEMPFAYRSEENSTHYFIHFTGYAAEELLESVGIETNRVYSPGLNERSAAAIGKIFKAFRYRRAMWELEAAVGLGEFAVEIGRSIAPSTENSDPIRQAAAYIQANVGNAPSVTELAARTYMSVSGFSAKFKRYYGMAPSEYITAVRISHASRLLMETDLSVEAVAHECGFGDPLYFSRMFRKSCGVSPREWRKRNRI